eukprot:7383630-Prymnesium_polylepis.1
MAQVSPRGRRGYLLRSELPALLGNANAKTGATVKELEQVLLSIEASEQLLELPEWAPARAQQQQLNAVRVTSLLVQLSTVSPVIEQLFG